MKKLFLLVGVLAFFFTIVCHYAVPITLTEEDREYIPKIIKNVKSIRKNAIFEEEIAYIYAIQSAVFGLAKANQEIPKFHAREPKDLYFLKHGLCSDRSRTIEKILRHAGFNVRHANIYSILKKPKAYNPETDKHNKNLRLVTPFYAVFFRTGYDTTSHSVSEVLTKKGWLIVDSNYKWLSLDTTGNPVSLNKLMQYNRHYKLTNWLEEYPIDLNDIYEIPFTYVYGLYSRHGKYYPPYSVIPDINYTEFLLNLTFKHYA